ncbi:helix-turn-helix transcriptional regulator [Apilactobacillus sp. TMW 2.2459]|uniref:helix-turn-helix domain-containing protein n=1 Tax=Apilactobacillus xinyiensis TaxID=2841032 RepID=UPI00200DC969|nr:helix-turn-helix transcriptional regulator [Apilactobacillus xinyiensis]MCL0311549.1 helix-turn-helix transcriptional regulator [Apilactobacillus xinyiensis]
MNKTLIPDLRKQRGWTQEHLASKCNLSVRTIQRLEAGDDTSLETLRLIAQAFNVKVGDLFESISDNAKGSEIKTMNDEQITQMKKRKEESKLIRNTIQMLFILAMMIFGYLLHNSNYTSVLGIIWVFLWPLVFYAIKLIKIYYIDPKLDKKYPLTINIK